MPSCVLSVFCVPCLSLCLVACWSPSVCVRLTSVLLTSCFHLLLHLTSQESMYIVFVFLLVFVSSFSVLSPLKFPPVSPVSKWYVFWILIFAFLIWTLIFVCSLFSCFSLGCYFAFCPPTPPFFFFISLYLLFFVSFSFENKAPFSFCSSLPCLLSDLHLCPP